MIGSPTPDELREALERYRLAKWRAAEVIEIVRELWGEPDAGALPAVRPGAPSYRRRARGSQNRR